MITNTGRASQYFKPIGGLIPAGILTTDEYNATAQTFVNPATIYARSSAASFNTQGQRWQDAGAGDADGVANAASDRTGVTHIIETEFEFTGTILDIAFVGSDYYDSQVYIEVGGQMYKAKAAPLTGTTTGLMYRRIVFAAPFHGRIRFVLGGGAFVGVGCEQSAIIKPSPDRAFGVCDGDKWVDGAGIKQASGTSFLTGGLCDYLFERTGIVWARRGYQSGFFYNGSGTVTADTTGPSGATRWFSAARKVLLGDDLAAKPLFFLLVGTLEDGGRGSATGSPTGPMATRALDCLQWIRGLDRHVTIVHVSPMPFAGAGVAGTLTGPPSPSSGHDYNRIEQAAAVAKTPKAVYINAFGPTAPWWTGAGSNGSPTTSQQAGLIGADGATPNDQGFAYLAAKIANLLAAINVDLPRARGQR